MPLQLVRVSSSSPGRKRCHLVGNPRIIESNRFPGITLEISALMNSYFAQRRLCGSTDIAAMPVRYRGKGKRHNFHAVESASIDRQWFQKFPRPRKRHIRSRSCARIDKDHSIGFVRPGKVECGNLEAAETPTPRPQARMSLLQSTIARSAILHVSWPAPALRAVLPVEAGLHRRFSVCSRS